MNLRMLRALVLVLTAFVAVSMFVCFDDLREYEAAYVQGEMLKESADHLAGHRRQQLSYGAPASSAKRKIFTRLSSREALCPGIALHLCSPLLILIGTLN